MYAVIKTGGKQIKAEAGKYIDVEKLPNKEGDKVTIEDVLMLVSGKDSKVGNPTIPGAKVNGEIIKQDRTEKLVVFKMRPKKGTRRTKGHRQSYSRVFIESIELDGKKVAEAKDKPKPQAARKSSEPRTPAKKKAGKE